MFTFYVNCLFTKLVIFVYIFIGDDVYFECTVRANPQPYKITWRHNGRELTHNLQKKIIISNRSLVLQKVTRADTGVYTCTAHNSEGDGVSNSINLNVKCKSHHSFG